MDDRRLEDAEYGGGGRELQASIVALLDSDATEESQLDATSALRIRAMKSPEAVRIATSDLEAIRSRLSQWPVRVRREVVAALGEVGGEAVVDILAARIEDPDAYTQMLAVDALYRVATEHAVDAIGSLGEQSQFEQVNLHAFQAAEVLRSLGGETAGPEASAPGTPPAVRSRQAPVRDRRSSVRERSGIGKPEERQGVARAASSALRQIASAHVSSRVREYIDDALRGVEG